MYLRQFLLIFTLLLSGHLHADFFVPAQKIISPENNTSSWGAIISMDEDKLLVSAFVDVNEVSNAGAVDFYLKDASNQWEFQSRLTAPIDYTLEVGWVGFVNTGLVETTLLVGAPFADSGLSVSAGKVFIYNYEESQNNWSFTHELQSHARDANELYGYHSLNENMLAVGSSNYHYDGVGSGRVYLYQKNLDTGEWIETQRIDSPHIHVATSFGHSVKLLGDELLVKISYQSEDLNDGVIIFKKNSEGIFEQSGLLKPDGDTPSADFGGDMLAENNELIIAANNEYIPPPEGSGSRDGAIYYYLKDDQGYWQRQQKLISPVNYDAGLFGVSFVRKGDVMFVVQLVRLPGTGKFERIRHQYQLNPNTKLWEHKQILSRLEPSTFTSGESGDAFNGEHAVMKVVDQSSGKRVDAVYIMKRVPENKIDLTITQSTTLTEVEVNRSFSVDYTVTNTGEDTSTGNNFYTTYESLSNSEINCGLVEERMQCPLNDLSPGETQSFTINYLAPIDAGFLQLIATVVTDLGEADSLNNAVLSSIAVNEKEIEPIQSSGGGSANLFLHSWLLVLLILRKHRLRKLVLLFSLR